MPLNQFKEKWRILENVSLQIAEGTGTSHKQGITQRIHQFKADKGMIDDIIAVLREEKEEIKEAISAAMKDEHEQMKYCIGQLEYNIRDLQIQIGTGTGVANQEKKKSGKSVYFVKWTLDNADSSIIDRIKLNLQNVPQLSEFEILRVYGGSVQIESSISYVIFHNPENIVSCIFEFLKMVAILCKVDTSKNATIDVDIVVSDIPWNDKIKDMPVKMACDELRETVNRYLSHSQKKWKHCATVSVPMVITESVSVSIVKTDYKEEQPITMSSGKRKSKSKGLQVSKRTRSAVARSDEEDIKNIPSTSGSYIPPAEYMTWSKEDVAKKMETYDLWESAKIFRAQKITGDLLDMLNEEDLEKMGIGTMGDKLKVMKFIKEITGITDVQDRKIFNDPVNGHTEIHPLCTKIIDTPQFQRLRDLKQSGTCYFVYPGATNNRFEHCIGVCYLAGQFVRTLQKRQPELNITNKDILCVEIAGLCHDLGHGPFSHLFDSKFIPRAKKGCKWKHEDGSIMMFKYLVKTNNLMAAFGSYGLVGRDLTFIEEQIAGHLGKKNEGWQYKGREQEKGFLYEIVANDRNGIDVDKMDYFARDCHGLGIKNTFDHNRFMKFARVLKVNGGYQICCRDKEAETLYSMFQTRTILHRRAYQHRVCNAVEVMILDAFLAADKTAIVPGKDGKLKKLSECIDDPEAFTNLSDNIFYVILMSTDEKLAKSKGILRKILHRQLYACVGETNPTDTKLEASSLILTRIMSNIPKDSDVVLQEDDLHIDLVELDYGSKSENPLNNVCFYNKNKVKNPIKIQKHQVSLMLPTVFEEKIVRLYCKKNDEKSLALARTIFVDWCADNGYTLQTKISKVRTTDE